MCKCLSQANVVGSLKEWSGHVGTKEDNKKQRLWLAIENQRRNWDIFAKRIITRRFKAELISVKKSVTDSITNTTTMDGADNIIGSLQNKVSWAASLSAIYLPVAENFGNVVLDNLKSDNQLQHKQNDPFDFWNNAVLGWILNNSSTKIVQITDFTRKLVRESLAEGVGEGEGIDVLAKRIDKLYLAQIIPFRSEVIARTEVIASSNLGSRAAAIHTGLNLSHEWLAASDFRTRENHIVASGQKHELNTPYTVGGDKLMFPGDISFGASAGNIIQCRCAEIFGVIRDE